MVDINPQTSGRIIAGRYRLGPRLGSGQDVAVFDAFDEQLQRMVVLKVVHPDLGDVPQVRREFRAIMAVAAGLNHPNVAPVLDFGTDQWGSREVLYVVTERYAGGSLRDILDRGRLLAPSQALVVGLDACKALDAVHRIGLVHADVRPSTLVFGDDRRLRLADVGLAQVLHGVAGDTAGRDSDRVRYCSPEQAQGLAPGAKSDVYSLCLTLLESLSGSVPFESDSAVATMANRVDKLMPVSADLGPLAAVLERAGRPNADDRYTAAEFGRALVQAAEKLPRPAPLPILGNSLFSADAAEAAPPAEAIAPSVASPISITTTVSSSQTSPTAAPPTMGFPVNTPPGAPLDPDDADLAEFAVPPPPPRNRKWLIALLVVMAALGGGLAWYNARPDNVKVPDLVGLEEGVALNKVAGSFKGVVEREPSEIVETGLVIRTDPPADSTLERDSQLTIYVSSGPAPRVLPELADLTLEEATAKLEELGLVIAQADPAYSEDVEKGVVISWLVPESPALVAGGTVTKGTTVQVVVSNGPTHRVVPDLTNKSLADATAALTALNLEIDKGDDVFSPTAPAGTVAEQTPAKDTTLLPGDKVTVKMSKGPEMIAIPATKGLDYNGIVAALQTAGFTVGTVSGNVALAFIGFNVNGALAIPGMQFPKGTRVELFFKAK